MKRPHCANREYPLSGKAAAPRLVSFSTSRPAHTRRRREGLASLLVWKQYALCLLLTCAFFSRSLKAQEPLTVCREAAFAVHELRFVARGIGIVDVGTADFDDDGYAEFAVSGPGFGSGVWLLRGGPTGPTFAIFPFEGELVQQRGARQLVTGDFNGDGLTDFAVQVSQGCIVGLNEAKERFRGAPLTTCGNGDDMMTIDFDQDGRLDLLWWSDRGGSVGVVRGNGDGTFESLGFGTQTPVAFDLAVETGDFNGDGWPDVAVAGTVAVTFRYPEAREQTLQVMLGDGTGAFHAVDVGSALRLGRLPYRIKAADLNRDGRLDLVVTDAAVLRVLLGDGSGRFSLAPSGEMALPLPAWSLFLEDFNGDGDTDIAISPLAGFFNTGTSRGYAIFLGDGQGGFTLDDVSLTDFEPSLAGGFAVAADFVGNGRPDLAKIDFFLRPGGIEREVVVTTFANSCPTRVTKKALSAPIAGETVTYRLGVKNVAETATLEDVKVIESGSDQGITVDVRGTTAGTPCSLSPPRAECSFGTLLPGDERSAEVDIQVTDQSDQFGPANLIRNGAEATWDGGSAPTRSMNRIQFGADLLVSQTASADPALRGGELIYTIEVSNVGTETATEVVLENRFPEFTEVLTAPDCEIDIFPRQAVARCPLPDIAPGEMTAVEMTVAIAEQGVAHLQNRVSVAALGETFDPDNASVLSTIVVAPGVQPGNASFEEGDVGDWIPEEGLETAFFTSPVHSGRGVIRVGSSGLLYQEVEGLTPARTYSLRAWTWAAGKAALRARAVGGDVLGVDGPRETTHNWAVWQTLFRAPASGRIRIELETIVPDVGLPRPRDLGILWDDVELQPVAPKTIQVPEVQPSIQAAIDAAQDGDVISVGPGIYREVLDFQAKAIRVESREGPATTILDAGRNGNAVTLASGEPSATVLRGMTIRNGHNGVFIQGSPLIEDNWVTDNGGGVLVRSGTPRLTGNRFQFNETGGNAASATIIGNRFSENDAGLVIGGPFLQNEFVRNGGSLLVRASAVVRDNLIEGNVGPGIAIVLARNAVIEQNLIVGNIPDSGNPWGGMRLSLDGEDNQVRVNNNTIVLNQGRSVSGVTLEGADSTVLFYNNLIVSDSEQPAVTCVEQTRLQFRTNLVFNFGGVLQENCGPLFFGGGNVSRDPKFVDAAGDDYRLGAGSPAIDAGLDQFLPPRDFDGLPRSTDGNGDGVASVDIGAYERPARTVFIAPARSRMRGSRARGLTESPR